MNKSYSMQGSKTVFNTKVYNFIVKKRRIFQYYRNKNLFIRLLLYVEKQM